MKKSGVCVRFICRCLSRFGCIFDGGGDTLVGSATTDVAIHGTHDLMVRRLRVFSQQREGGENHAGCAEAALHGVVLQKGLLERMQAPVLFETLDGDDGLVADSSNLRMAGTGGHTIDQDGAGAALAFTAAIFTAGEIEIVAQNAEQSSLAVDIDFNGLAIDLKFRDLGHRLDCANSACRVAKPLQAFHAKAINHAKEEVSRRLGANLHIPAGLKGATAAARQNNRKIHMSVAVAIGISAAVNDHRIVEERFSVNVFCLFHLLEEPGELLHVEEVNLGDFVDHVFLAAVMREEV